MVSVFLLLCFITDRQNVRYVYQTVIEGNEKKCLSPCNVLPVLYVCIYRSDPEADKTDNTKIDKQTETERARK